MRFEKTNKKNKLTYGLGFGLIAIGAGAFRNP